MKPIAFYDLDAIHGPLRCELDAAWHRVTSSGRFILSEEVAEFEQAFATYCGTSAAVGVGSGLDALQLILRGYGIGPGDEVIVPAHTYIATWLAVSQVGARPVPVDCEDRFYGLDLTRLEDAIGPATRAVICVHLYGQPDDVGAIASVSKRHGLKLIEDAAQSHGARLAARRTGSLGDAGAFSFYPGKNLGAFGDGGAVTSNDEALLERIRALRNYGSDRKYHHPIQGMNSRLDALQAAVLGVKLPHLDGHNQRRKEIAERYLKALAPLAASGLGLPEVREQVEHVWHQFIVRHPKRDALRNALSEQRVETLLHYPVPPHRCGAYAEQGHRLEVTERVCSEVLSLPMGPHLSDEDVDAVCERMERALAFVA